MKKFLFSVMIAMFVCFTFTGCDSASDNSYTAEIRFLAPTQEEVFAHRDSLDTDKYEVIEMVEQKKGSFWVRYPAGWVLRYKEIGTNTTAEIQFFAPTQEEVFAHRDSLDTDKYEVIAMVEHEEGCWYSAECPGGWILKYKEIDTNKEETNSTEEHSCVWDVKEVGNKVVVFCKECGKMAE